MAEAVIKEGFICPICHKDMHDPRLLLTHFQEIHSEEQDILSSLKELVGKAKKKILKIDERDLENFKTEIRLQKYHLEESEPQPPGQVKTHTDYYKEMRRERLDHRTSETNKLIIRLDQLLNLSSFDRKQEEQKIVPWIEGAIIDRCPSCTAPFNITRRQHHCRLCGSIMCHNCSHFLQHSEACVLVAPVHSETSKVLLSERNNTENLRICVHCKDMLECRRQVLIHQSNQPTICKLYHKLQKVRLQLQPSVDLYYKMYSSLSSGDSTFQLQDAQSLRSSIAKQAEILDVLSKKILAEPVDSNTNKVYHLQNTIRRATSQYIKDYLLVLPVLPTPAELERIKHERLTRNHHETAAPAAFGPVKKLNITTGWSPSSITNQQSSSDDPLLEQINIVENYIEQAQNAGRFEEVAVLRENLKMLRREMQQTRDSQEYLLG